jgi:hypothetical protein
MKKKRIMSVILYMGKRSSTELMWWSNINKRKKERGNIYLNEKRTVKENNAEHRIQQ